MWDVLSLFFNIDIQLLLMNQFRCQWDVIINNLIILKQLNIFFYEFSFRQQCILKQLFDLDYGFFVRTINLQVVVDD